MMMTDSIKIDSVEAMMRHWLQELGQRDRELDELTYELRTLRDELRDVYQGNLDVEKQALQDALTYCRAHGEIDGGSALEAYLEKMYPADDFPVKVNIDDLGEQEPVRSATLDEIKTFRK